MATLIFDCEVAPNAFGLGIKRVEDGRKVWYEHAYFENTGEGDFTSDFDRDLVRRALRNNQIVGFNSAAFDIPIIYMALDGASTQELMDAATRIIQERIPAWRAENEFGIHIPKLDHIDLYDCNPSVMTGLKQLGARQHVKLLQDLPFKPNTNLTRAEWVEGREYCLNGDLEATHALFDRLGEAIALRKALGDQNELELRSASDAQVGERLIKKSVEDKKGERVKKAVIAEGSTFRYDAPEWMSFKTPLMKQVFETIKNTDFVIGKGGKVSFPKEFDSFEIVFDGMQHALGIGGLHSTEANRSVHSDNEFVLIDGDVASQYPNIIMKLGLFPKALGKDFLTVYGEIIERRLKAKAQGKAVNAALAEATDPTRIAELKAEKARLAVEDKGAKIQLNGSYGKLGSPYSVLFAPHLMVAVTLTGQLSLLMLIEEAHLRGIPVVSANTDGVLFRCPRSMFNGFVMRDGKPTDRLAPSPIQDIIEWWEGVTSFKMEFGEYRSVYNQSVNTYMAISPDGSYKRKGVLANHWRAELPWGGRNSDYDPARSGLMKNPQMTICADAALGLILHGIPVEKTIRECRDVREFITVVNATGGATWGNGAPIYKTIERTDSKGKTVRSEALVGIEGEQYLGKVVRYYWSVDGGPILKVNGHNVTGNRPKVSKTDGCRPLMILPDDYAVPDDLDHQRYIDAAYEILRDIGFYDREEAPAAQSPWEALLCHAIQQKVDCK